MRSVFLKYIWMLDADHLSSTLIVFYIHGIQLLLFNDMIRPLHKICMFTVGSTPTHILRREYQKRTHTFLVDSLSFQLGQQSI